MAKKASASVPELAAYNAAKKVVDNLVMEVADKADALAKARDAAQTAADYKALKDATEELKKLRAKVSTAAEDLNSARDAARTALEAYIADLKAQQAQQQAQAQPTQQAAPSALPPGVFPDTIAGSNMKVVSSSIGGTTGAKLVEIDGRRYILKQNRSPSGVYKAGATSPEHVRNEAAADQAYRRAGIRVPDCRIYEEGGVTYKLSEFIPDGKTLGSYLAHATPAQKKAVLDELKQGYIVDALFANWDVIGTDKDNVLVDKDGHAWRIDNGSAFGFRAQGSRKKPEEFETREWPDEWRTLRTSPINRGVFDKLTAHDIFSSKVDLDAVVAGLPEETKKAIAKPLAEMKQMQGRCANFDVGGYKGEHTSEVLEYSYDLSKMGMREQLPKRVDQYDSGFGWLRPSSTRQSAATASPTQPAKDILTAYKNIKYHIQSGGKPNMAKIQVALGWKNDLQLAQKAGDKNAAALLDHIAKIEGASMHKFQQIEDTTISVVGVKFPKAKSQAQPVAACFSDMLQQAADAQGVNIDLAYQIFREQGSTSSSKGSCIGKILEFEAIGVDIRHPPKEAFVRPGVKGVLDHFDKHPAEKEEYRKAMNLFKAATQLLLENTELPFKNDETKTVRLMRTSDFSAQYDFLKKGGIYDFIPEGGHESYGSYHTVIVSGSELLIRDVPFSRITSTYLTTREGSLYLGDSENEFGANTVGLPAYYHGRTQRFVSWDAFSAEVEAAEKKHGRTLRDFNPGP